MERDQTLSKIISDISKDHPKGLTDDDIHDIVSFQFIAVRHAISNRKFIELPRLGRFLVKEGRDKFLSPEKRFYEPHMKSSREELSQDDTEGTE